MIKPLPLFVIFQPVCHLHGAGLTINLRISQLPKFSHLYTCITTTTTTTIPVSE